MTASPIRSIRNQYRGVNAHLHSLFQAQGGWNNFHNRHIGDLTGALRRQLLPMGYTASMEESLQIRRSTDEVTLPRADIMIYDARGGRSPSPAAVPQAGLTVADLLLEDIDLERPYRAIAIYAQGEAGQPVAWIELLSPSNKPPGADAQRYLLKRADLLREGIVFVEMDYLHAHPPTFAAVADYTQPGRREAAHPYRIAVLDPRPDLLSGPAYLAEFDADEPIPSLHIPLNAGEGVEVDFGAVYQQTYEGMVYGLELVDYAALPAQWERYSQGDQARIARRLLSVLSAAQVGADLEAAPLPLIDAAPLDDLLTQLKMI